jgi:hypothetical protein
MKRAITPDIDDLLAMEEPRGGAQSMGRRRMERTFRKRLETYLEYKLAERIRSRLEAVFLNGIDNTPRSLLTRP